MCLFTNAVFVLHPGQILPRSGCNGTPASNSPEQKAWNHSTKFEKWFWCRCSNKLCKMKIWNFLEISTFPGGVSPTDTPLVFKILLQCSILLEIKSPLPPPPLYRKVKWNLAMWVYCKKEISNQNQFASKSPLYIMHFLSFIHGKCFCLKYRYFIFEFAQ